MDLKKISMVADEAVRLFVENPCLTYRQAIEKAEEMILNEKVGKVERAN